MRRLLMPAGMRPASSRGSELELPPDTYLSFTPWRSSTARTWAVSSPRFFCVGMMAPKQVRLVPRPARLMPGSCITSSTAAIRSLGQMPSRRSPRSTMRITSCTRPMRSATRDSSRSTPSSELRLTSTLRITSSTRDRGGERSSMMGASMPLSLRRRIFSKRDSARPATPPRSMARATCGMPQVPLVTPNTSMPLSRHFVVTTRALCSIVSSRMLTCGPSIVFSL